MSRHQRGLVLAAVPSTIALTSIWLGTSVTMRATAWLLVEAAVALVVALMLGLVATLVAGPRTLSYLNQFVSRGVELTAALPMVLLCAVVTVATRLPVPVAVAFVIGVLGGLRCVRVVASASQATPNAERAPSIGSLLRRSVKRSMQPVMPTIVEQIVGLEAALAWLGLFDRDWTGGWGERLGQAASHGQLAQLALWTLSTVALSVGLKVLFWQAPDRLADDLAVKSVT